MPYCYYTCNLLPLGLFTRHGFTPRWLSDRLVDPGSPARREALTIHPMTCPYVTRLVAAADSLFGGEAGEHEDGRLSARSTDAPSGCLVVPGGCDAARRMGDLLAAVYPQHVFVLPMPRSSGPEVEKALAADLHRLEGWLAARRPDGAARPSLSPGAGGRGPGPNVDYPAAPRPGGVFVVAGPLTDDSLLRLIGQLGAHVSGLESCTSPDRWRPLAAAGALPVDRADADAPAPAETAGPGLDHLFLARTMLAAGMCPRRSTVDRRAYLTERLDRARPTSIIYARQSFCDPGAYDALLVARLAQERGLPYLEIEVDFPFDANGPLRTRVEAFLEAQLLDDDLLDDDLLDDDLPDGDLPDDDLLDDDLPDGDLPEGPGDGDPAACGPTAPGVHTPESDQED